MCGSTCSALYLDPDGGRVGDGPGPLHWPMAGVQVLGPEGRARSTPLGCVPRIDVRQTLTIFSHAPIGFDLISVMLTLDIISRTSVG